MRRELESKRELEREGGSRSKKMEHESDGGGKRKKEEEGECRREQKR